MLEDVLTVEVPRGAESSERDGGATAGSEGVEHGGELGGWERGENVARGVRVGLEGEERAPRGEGEGGRQVPWLPASAALAGRVVRAAEARRAGGGGGGRV